MPSHHRSASLASNCQATPRSAMLRYHAHLGISTHASTTVITNHTAKIPNACSMRYNVVMPESNPIKPGVRHYVTLRRTIIQTQQVDFIGAGFAGSEQQRAVAAAYARPEAWV